MSLRFAFPLLVSSLLFGWGAVAQEPMGRDDLAFFPPLPPGSKKDLFAWRDIDGKLRPGFPPPKGAFGGYGAKPEDIPPCPVPATLECSQKLRSERLESIHESGRCFFPHFLLRDEQGKILSEAARSECVANGLARLEGATGKLPDKAFMEWRTWRLESTERRAKPSPTPQRPRSACFESPIGNSIEAPRPLFLIRAALIALAPSTIPAQLR